MATLDINMIRDYLISVGCKIEYPILVKSFKQHLYNPDPDLQGRIRTLFKDYVNTLATVSVENNMKFIILRPDFRPQTEAIATPASHLNLQQKESRPAQQQMVQQQQRSSVTSLANQVQPSKLWRQQSQQPVNAPPFLNQSKRSNSMQAGPPPVPMHQGHQQSYIRDAIRLGPHPMTTPVVTNLHNHREAGYNQTMSMQTSMPQPTQNAFRHQEDNSYHPPKSDGDRQLQRPLAPVQQSINEQHIRGQDFVDTATAASLQPPPLPPLINRRTQSLQQPEQQQSRPESLDLSRRTLDDSNQMPPPRPPPRRRQSTASMFDKAASMYKPIEKSCRDVHELAKKSLAGRVREHALKFSSTNSTTSELNISTPRRNSSMKENRLSRDSALGTLSSALQRNGSHMTNRSRSSHREDDSDSSSLQHIDPLRRKWAIEACNCNYNGLVALLRDEPKLASYKDIVNGYTAIHWAAKFGNLDIIKLIVGTHQVSASIKSSAGHTPLHVAYIFNRLDAANLLLVSYKANPNIRDHSGKKPLQYLKKSNQITIN